MPTASPSPSRPAARSSGQRNATSTTPVPDPDDDGVDPGDPVVPHGSVERHDHQGRADEEEAGQLGTVGHVRRDLRHAVLEGRGDGGEARRPQPEAEAHEAPCRRPRAPRRARRRGARGSTTRAVPARIQAAARSEVTSPAVTPAGIAADHEGGREPLAARRRAAARRSASRRPCVLLHSCPWSAARPSSPRGGVLGRGRSEQYTANRQFRHRL